MLRPYGPAKPRLVAARQVRDQAGFRRRWRALVCAFGVTSTLAPALFACSEPEQSVDPDARFPLGSAAREVVETSVGVLPK